MSAGRWNMANSIELEMLQVAQRTPTQAEEHLQHARVNDFVQAIQFVNTVGGWPRFIQEFPRLVRLMARYEAQDDLTPDLRLSALIATTIARSFRYSLEGKRESAPVQ